MQTFYFLPLVLALLYGTVATHAAATVQHSLDSGRTFSTAGHISLDDNTLHATFQRQPVTDSQILQLQQLVEADGLYLWRVHLPDQPPVLTSIKAACLASAFMKPELSLHLDAAGRIVSAQINVPAAATPHGSCVAAHALQSLKLLSADQLSGPEELDVVVTAAVPGPAVPQKPAGAELPDLMAAAGGAPQQQAPKKPQQQRPVGQQGAAGSSNGAGGAEGGKEGEQAPPVDDRTWLQKNWLIVMAGATMVLNIALRAATGDQPAPGGGPGRAPQGRRIVQ